MFHKSHSKNRRKRHLIGSAYVCIADILRRQSHPGHGRCLICLHFEFDFNLDYVDLDLRLSCPPPQKRSPTVGGTRKLNTAMLTIRLRPPTELPSSTSSVTAVDTPLLSQDEDGVFSDVMSDYLSCECCNPITVLFRLLTGSPASSPPTEQPLKDLPQIQIEAPNTSNVLRNRKKKPKPYTINTTDDGSSSDSSCYPPSPVDLHPDFCPTVYGAGGVIYDDDITPSASCSVLPQYTEQEVIVRQLSFIERLLDRFAPYEELCYAEHDSQFEKVLGRLLTEWYVVGASVSCSLLGLDHLLTR